MNSTQLISKFNLPRSSIFSLKTPSQAGTSMLATPADVSFPASSTIRRQLQHRNFHAVSFPLPSFHNLPCQCVRVAIDITSWKHKLSSSRL